MWRFVWGLRRVWRAVGEERVIGGHNTGLWVWNVHEGAKEPLGCRVLGVSGNAGTVKIGV